MTGDKFRPWPGESINTADAMMDPVRKFALMDAAQRWLRLAAQIDGPAGKGRTEKSGRLSAALSQ